MWNKILEEYKDYITIERSFSENSIEAYMRDINSFYNFLKSFGEKYEKIESVDLNSIQNFIYLLNNNDISIKSQSRIISGIRSFFKYLILEDLIEDDPSELIEMPKKEDKLPTVLSIEEVESLINANDMSTKEGERNRAIVELLYGCGIRVSELINVKITDLHFDESYIMVIGKGNKQRIVPIGTYAISSIKNYIDNTRNQIKIHIEYQNYLFISRLGKGLTRIMIFNIIKELSKKANIEKEVSPHTLRHSFATHLVDNGANIRAVQEMLGHESILTTEIYVNFDTKQMREAIILYHPRK